jgi:curved DNA-binding protein CbpA
MKTLYDLLGALPDDDAEGLRDAFRKAAKASHPDVNAADPDAPLRFRQVMRANEILSDPQQRAAYDRLMVVTAAEAVAAARPQQQRQQQRRPAPAPVRRTIRRIVFDAITVASLSTMSIGGYLLFDRFSKASADFSGRFEVAARPGPANFVGPANVIGPPIRPFDIARQDEPSFGGGDGAVATESAAPSTPAVPETSRGSVPTAKATLSGTKSVRRAYAGIRKAKHNRTTNRFLKRTRTALAKLRPIWAINSPAN